jgi:hypothetical protein
LFKGVPGSLSFRCIDHSGFVGHVECAPSKKLQVPASQFRKPFSDQVDQSTQANIPSLKSEDNTQRLIGGVHGHAQG